MQQKQKKYFPLSSGQTQLWYLEHLYPNTKAHNVQSILKLFGILNINCLKKALRKLVMRHDSLRTKITDIDGTGYQYIEPYLQLNIDIKNVLNLPQDKITTLIHQEGLESFDFFGGSLFRITLYKVNTKTHLLLITMHHVIMDGWSVDIISRELGSIYDDIFSQKEISLKRNTRQYTDFVVFQQNQLDNDISKKKVNYWQKSLEGAPPILEFSGALRKSANCMEICKSHNLKIPANLIKKIKRIAYDNNASIFMLVSAIFIILLSRYSIARDIIVGIPFANRSKRIDQDIVGFFVNTMPIKVTCLNEETFIDILNKVRRTIFGGLLNQEVPFEQLVKVIQPERNINYNPIFQVTMNHLDFTKPTFKSKNLTVTREFSPNIGSVFDLVVSLVETEDGTSINFDYPTGLFEDDTIKQISTHTRNLLENICLDPHKQIQHLNLLNTKEKDLLLQWNATSREYQSDKTIHRLFEEQVENAPNSLAVIYNEVKLTYRELNIKANKLAHHLVALGAKPESFITICLENSAEYVVVLLAILKANCVYVPLDASYPSSRINLILEDTSSHIVITISKYVDKFKGYSGYLLSLDEEASVKKIETYDDSNVLNTTTPEQLAYVMYTSGTTGMPKGVMIEHRAVVRFVKDTNYIKIMPNDRITQASNVAFDSTIFEVWGALLNGAKLFIMPKSVLLSALEFKSFLQKHSINIMLLTSGVFDQLTIADTRLFHNIKYLLVGGDKVSLSTVRAILENQNTSPRHLINCYGPTENTTFTTTYKIIVDKLIYNSVPIGRPISNSVAYVLDENYNPLPIGVVGELYVGGIGIARGYLNKPCITAEKFINNPFQSAADLRSEKNKKLYKTGDLARWLPCGNLEYIGRNDSQVKIRGYRVELEEIETVLSEYEGIKQSIVIVQENASVNGNNTGNKYLVGYYVSSNKLDERKIVSYLQAKLPEYMVPTALIHLEKLPLTINGKLDRKTLPKHRFTLNDSYLAPRNELESQVLQILEEVLGLPAGKVGIQDDFFNLGGNSIMAIKLLDKLNNYYNSSLKIIDIFINRSVELISSKLIQTKVHYQAIIKLNTSNNNPNMFMIHPGQAGCEVYTSLASMLNNHFSCYGVDSYNLYHENKIDNLNELAKFYLSQIDTVMTKTGQKTYHLLGWSLGGRFALEIAKLLEQMNSTVQIKVYLLDTLLFDEHLLVLRKSISFIKIINQYRDSKRSEGYENSYIEKVVSNMHIENKFLEQQINFTLINTQVLLFKPELSSKDEGYAELKKINEYAIKLPYNNIDKFIKDIASIRVIKVNNVHHWNILNSEQIIATEILKT